MVEVERMGWDGMGWGGVGWVEKTRVGKKQGKQVVLRKYLFTTCKTISHYLNSVLGNIIDCNRGVPDRSWSSPVRDYHYSHFLGIQIATSWG